MKIQDLTTLRQLRAAGMEKLMPADRVRIAVGMGTCGIGSGADEVYKAFARELERQESR